jgi:DNA-directed RNA polymerase I subunit RPA43
VWQFIPNEADEGAPDTTTTDEDVPIAKGGSQPRSLGYWVDGSGERVDGKLRFTVKAFNVSGRVVSVQGTLLPLGQVREDLTQRSTPKKVFLDSEPSSAKKHVHFDGDETNAEENEKQESGETTNDSDDSDQENEFGNSGSDSD